MFFSGGGLGDNQRRNEPKFFINTIYTKPPISQQQLQQR